MASNRRTRIWLVVGIGLAILPLALLMTWSLGFVEGVEFSPDDFSRREFRYNRVPYLGITLLGIGHEDRTSALERSLIADGWIGTSDSDTKRWDLVSDSASVPVSPDFDARFLCDYLDRQATWTEFNQKSPLKARLFWPAVSHLARHGMYTYLPDLMELGLGHESHSEEEFGKNVASICAEAYLKRAGNLAESDPKSAAELADCSLEFRDSSEARKLKASLRAKSPETSPKSDPPPLSSSL